MQEENKPLYAQIIEDIREKINQNKLVQDQRLPSEIDIANSYGVSRITSKRALEDLEREGYIYRIKGSGSYVSKRQKNEVRSGSAESHKLIDIVLPFDSSLGRSIDLIHGANDYLQKNDYYFNIQNTHHDAEKEKEILLNLYKNNVSGIIYYPISGGDNIDVMQMLVCNDFPIITVDKYFDGLDIASVVSDNFSGSYDAVSYLIKNGHENIGYISDCGLESISSVRERFLGYCKALRDNGFELKYNNYVLNYAAKIIDKNSSLYKNMVLQNSPISKEFMDFFKVILDSLLDRNDKVTAIQTVNDYVAMFTLKTALDMGIKVPEELSIVGFDNIEISQLLEVPLTTVEQDFYHMGYDAAMLLHKAIVSGKPVCGKKLIPTKLIERNSVFNLKK